MKRSLTVLVTLVLVLAACGGDDASESTTTTEAATTTTSPAPSTSEAGPAISPAEVVFEDQESDGSSIVVASVTLPSPGFIAVHGNADGAPGPVIGNSELLPAGVSTDVVVELDNPLTTSDLVFPMAHIDMDSDGVYEFMPPDNAVDIPATTSDGSVAVVGGEVSVTGADAGAEIQVTSTDLGDVVVDSDGNTLYLFTPDAQGDSTCYDQCEANWPPLVGDVTAGEGLDADLLGSTDRTDGSVQVTYNGWPLYYFAGDTAPGDTNGQGLNGVWFVVSPDGNAVS